MKTFEKILKVLAKNLGLTVVLALSVILFAVFSDGLIRGAITAISALMAYVSIVLLYKEYRHANGARAVKNKKK